MGRGPGPGQRRPRAGSRPIPGAARTEPGAGRGQHALSPEGYSAGSWRRPPAWTTYVPLDHLRAVGPLKCGWTTWFTKYGGPTERKWSNRTQVVQAGRPRHDMRDAVPPCGTRRRGGAGAGGAGTAPAPPGPPPTTGPPIPSRPTPPPGAPGGDPGGPSRPAPRPSALDNPSYHTRGTHSEPLPEQPSQYRLPEIRPDARRITFHVQRAPVCAWEDFTGVEHRGVSA